MRVCINIAALENSLAVYISIVFNLLIPFKLVTSPLELSLKEIIRHRDAECPNTLIRVFNSENWC